MLDLTADTVALLLAFPPSGETVCCFYLHAPYLFTGPIPEPDGLILNIEPSAERWFFRGEPRLTFTQTHVSLDPCGPELQAWVATTFTTADILAGYRAIPQHDQKTLFVQQKVAVGNGLPLYSGSPR